MPTIHPNTSRQGMGRPCGQSVCVRQTYRRMWAALRSGAYSWTVRGDTLKPTCAVSMMHAVA